MKRALVTISICLLANPLFADNVTTNKWLNNISGTFDLTSNYIFRGISQTTNKPAAQGGLTYTFPVGLYFSVWGSNTNYTTPDGKTVTSEFDTAAGWEGDIKGLVTYNINIERYNYPGAYKVDYNELNTLFTYKILTLGVSYTDNYYGTHVMCLYYNGTLSYDIPSQYIHQIEGVNVAAEFGHSSFARDAGLSYNDYSLALNKKINETYTVTAQWTRTQTVDQSSHLMTAANYLGW